MQNPSQPNPLSKQDIEEYIKCYQLHNDENAQTALVLHYKPLIEHIARKYSKGKSYHEDIVQVGIIGLLGAIRRYDSTIGKSFEAFAVPTVVGEIKRFLRDKTWSIHVPRRIKELGPKINKTAEELTTLLHRSPKINEIASALDVSEENVLEAMEMGKSYQALSVDHAFDADSEGGTLTLLDIVGKEDAGFEKVIQRLVLERVLHVLNAREREIIQCTFLDNLSQKETGEKLGISQMHVSRLQRRAIKKLRDAILSDDRSSECLS